jgi:hypothetical protein
MVKYTCEICKTTYGKNKVKWIACRGLCRKKRSVRRNHSQAEENSVKFDEDTNVINVNNAVEPFKTNIQNIISKEISISLPTESKPSLQRIMTQDEIDDLRLIEIMNERRERLKLK